MLGSIQPCVLSESQTALHHAYHELREARAPVCSAQNMNSRTNALHSPPCRDVRYESAILSCICVPFMSSFCFCVGLSIFAAQASVSKLVAIVFDRHAWPKSVDVLPAGVELWAGCVVDPRHRERRALLHACLT